MNAKRLLAVLAGVGMAAAGIVGGSASADQSPPPPPYRVLNGVGADTTQQVMNGLSNAVTVNGTAVIASWDTSGLVPIQTESSPACVLTSRPNGSTPGRTALLKSLNANDGCLQFARDSTGDNPPSTPSLTDVPFADENVTFMVTAQSNVPRSLQLSDLHGIYTCNANYAGIIPVLPQENSSTRAYWESAMGITDADVNAGKYPCIWNGVTPNGQAIDDGDGRLLTNDTVAPVSVAEYIAQTEGEVADRHGQAMMGTIITAGAPAGSSGTYPITQNAPQTITSGASFPLSHAVYNLIPTSDTATAPWSTVFVGPGSLICRQTATIVAFGFTPAPDCGSTTNHS